jgi:diacylglycerol kinase family enzyme
MDSPRLSRQDCLLLLALGIGFIAFVVLATHFSRKHTPAVTSPPTSDLQTQVPPQTLSYRDPDHYGTRFPLTP